MNVLDLAEKIGLHPKRLASTRGGEYHSPCPDPACGGRDRFCIWPKQGEHGRYWCRHCQKSGDAIQFCRDFLALSFQESCQMVGKEVTMTSVRPLPSRPRFDPIDSELPSKHWQERALKFVNQSSQTLQESSLAAELLRQRGLSIETAKFFHLGYNPRDCWETKSEWDLVEEAREDGQPKRQWLPAGLVIPAFACDGSSLSKIKVRRRDWTDKDMLPKYVEISGSQKQYSVYGDRSLPIILVEAELDAILLQQEASRECCAIALGGASKRPDREIHQLLRSASRILFCLDFDDAGRKEYAFWRRTYHQTVAWPAPLGKSPGEAFQQGVCLGEWVTSGLKQSNNTWGKNG